MKNNKSSLPGLLIIAAIFLGVLIYSVFIRHDLVIERNNSNVPAGPQTGLTKERRQEPAEAPILTCTDSSEGEPVIISLSKSSGSVGDTLEIKGCNFSGFEGDKVAWIENGSGVKGILRGLPDSTAKSIRITLSSPLCSRDTSYSGLPCGEYLSLIPGKYKIYTEPWGKKSNVVDFVIN